MEWRADAGLGEVRIGEDGLHIFRGLAWRGKVERGLVGRGVQWQGGAWSGKARFGLVHNFSGQGMASFG